MPNIVFNRENILKKTRDILRNLILRREAFIIERIAQCRCLFKKNRFISIINIVRINLIINKFKKKEN